MTPTPGHYRATLDTGYGKHRVLVEVKPCKEDNGAFIPDRAGRVPWVMLSDWERLPGDRRASEWWCAKCKRRFSVSAIDQPFSLCFKCGMYMTALPKVKE